MSCYVPANPSPGPGNVRKPFKRLIQLAGDASTFGIGAVISHITPNGSERSVAYTSRTLTASECNYTQVEKEALSLVFGIKNFSMGGISQ